MNSTLSRRTAFGLAGAGLALGTAPASATGCVGASGHGALGWTSEFLTFDPVEHFRQSWRLQRSLADEADILHWYHFIMVAVPVGRSPQPVVRWEGIELSRHRKIGDNRYRLHGHNLSFARDLDTGRFTDKVRNPVTGRDVRPKTMALIEDPGMWASPEGIVPLDSPRAAPRPKYGMIRRESGIVKIDGIRVPPANWPGTFLEMGTESTPVALFEDRTLDWLPTDVSGAYVFPWPAWMEMGDAPGHMFAYWSGYKLRDVDQLPPEFLARAKAEYPQLLSVDLAQFERPVA
ncbi:hypothetical protein [Polymorphobacter sp.]|uniref:hypothetical protein n=1 Tax=Polymorphobacter sp. TaxID=1909290 RepID=UPI003F6E6874